MNSRKLQLAPSQLAGAIGPQSLNEASRTVECTFGSGVPVMRSSPTMGNFLESLDMNGAILDRAAAGVMPVLDAHDQSSISKAIGTVLSASVRNGMGYATLKITDDEAWAKIKDGTVKGISIGYRNLAMKDISPAKANTLSLLSISFEVTEISLAPVPADPSAMIRSFKNDLYEVEIKSGQSSEGNTVMDNERAELLRTLQIEKCVAAANLNSAVAEDMVTRGISIEDARTEVLKKLEEQTTKGQQRSHVNTEITSTNEDARRNGFVEALMARENPAYKPTDSAAVRPYMGRSILNAFEIFSGPRPMGMSDMQFATRALTTSDFPNILANYAEKSMRQEYQVQQPSFLKWTKGGTLRNYKNAYRLMLGDFPSLESLNEHGEIRQGSMSESKENIQLARYAKSIKMTKELLVNDDLSALSNFSTKAARAASRLESSLVYTSTLVANPTMGDSIAVFHASHGNLAASGAAIALDSVSAGWQAIRAQKTLDGSDYLDLTPKYLLCGLAKEAEALQFVSQSLLATKFSDVNPLAGKLEVIVDPRISGNQWFLACDPAQIDTIEIARLDNENGPLVHVVPDMNNPGAIKIICEHSVGAAVLDYRGLYKNSGN